jgi:hypothetical protein
MIVHLTQEISLEIVKKFDVISDHDQARKEYFANRSYGNDLKVLYIGLFCMSPKFEAFFKPQKPRYTNDAKVMISHGIESKIDAKSLEYELRLNYTTYLNVRNIKTVLAQDILKSLDTITTIKEIKDFNLSTFKHDLTLFFRLQGWIK